MSVQISFPHISRLTCQHNMKYTIYNYTIIVDTEDSSYRRVWETIKVVSKEFKHQGHSMKGPCASLVSGNSDKNIARDIQRSFNRLQLDPVSCAALSIVVFDLPH